MNIYVGNLHYKLAEEDLKEVFEEYGSVSSAKIIMDRSTGKSKGFGFVEMPDDEVAKHAIDNLNGVELMGRSLRVNVARNKTGSRPRIKRQAVVNDN
jgi:RNA recognition motif-containing protein